MTFSNAIRLLLALLMEPRVDTVVTVLSLLNSV